MVAWFIIAIGTVALFAYIAVMGVGAVDATGTAVSRAETTRRLETVVSMLSKRAAAIQADGVVYLPVGVAGSGRYSLPTDMQSIGRTTFGAQFQYCPMGLSTNVVDPNAATGNGTVSYQGGSYPIQTATPNGGRTTYVVAGRLATAAASDPNVIGFVVAPVDPDHAMSGCDRIVQSGESWTAPDSLVRAVRRSTTTDLDAARASDGTTWYVSARGDGSGQSPSSPSSIAAAFAAYDASLGGSFTIRMAPGSYSIDESPLDQTTTTIQAKKESSSLIIVGNGSALSMGGQINVPSNVEISGLNIGSTVLNVAAERYLTLTGSTSGPVLAAGKSRVLINGGNAIASSRAYPALSLLDGADAVVQGDNTFYYYANQTVVAVDPGSRATFSGSTQTIQPSDPAAASTVANAPIALAAGSEMTLRSVSFVFNIRSNYAFWIGGQLAGYGAQLNFQQATYVALQTAPGGRIAYWSTAANPATIGGASPPTYGIATQSASQATGNGRISSSGRCWYRGESSLHRYSPLGVAGDASAVSADEPDPYMDSQPTAQQVHDLQGVRARNAERVDLRNRTGRSSGSMSCQAATAATWTTCAAENGYCTLPVDANGKAAYSQVRYGANGSYSYRGVGEGVACNNQTFGDPIYGTVKTCDYQR